MDEAFQRNCIIPPLLAWFVVGKKRKGPSRGRQPRSSLCRYRRKILASEVGGASPRGATKNSQQRIKVSAGKPQEALLWLTIHDSLALHPTK